MRFLVRGRKAIGPGLATSLVAVLLLGCSGNGDGPTAADLPKDDTVWVRVSTDGVVPILTLHTARLDAESGERPAGVAASPINDADPWLYAFRNVDAFEPDVTGWKIRIQSNPAASGVCAQAKPDVASPQLTLCSELEPFSPL